MMRHVILTGAILALAALVQGGLVRDPAWQVLPGGDAQVAILKGANQPEAKFDPSEITFHYWSRDNKDRAIQLYIGYLNGVVMDFAKPIKFIVHGYTQTFRAPWIIDFKDKYLLTRDYHVISVDWEKPASGPFYDNAKQRTKPTGEVIGQFMDYLVTQGGDLGKMHCVGFSLGAHACGFAGKVQTNGVLGRISGLDPALPLYDYDDIAERLHEGDAKFVDVIHTCGGWLAFWHPLGHADFYPNDGTSEQPGCELEITGECSHDRSHELFAESIMAATFVSLQCESFPVFESGACDFNDEAPMGEPCPTFARGAYFLATRGKSPFAMG